MVRSEEAVALGQRVEEYRIDAWTGGAWKQVAQGTTIGYRKLDRFPKVKASFEPANALAEFKRKGRK